jgi:hypothetical protein
VRERNRRIALLEGQVNEERVRLARFREARLASPVPGVLWEVMTGSGEYVRRAQDVARWWTAPPPSSPPACANRSTTGSASATRRASACWRTAASSRAPSRASPAPAPRPSTAAWPIGPSAEHLKRYDVAMVFPALAADRSLGCAVGRTGPRRLRRPPLDPWRRMLAALGLG